MHCRSAYPPNRRSRYSDKVLDSLDDIACARHALFSPITNRKEGFRLAGRNANFDLTTNREETIMAWTTPTLVEICVGLEINGYLPAEF